MKEYKYVFLQYGNGRIYKFIVIINADCTFGYTLSLKVTKPEYDVHCDGKIARRISSGQKKIFQFWINQLVNKNFHLFIEAYIYSTITKDCFLV